MRLSILAPAVLAACSTSGTVGRAPEFSALEGSYQHHAMYSNPLPQSTDPDAPSDEASLWTAGRSSLFGDRRAELRGDILTVVIEIDERAEMSNQTDRSRSSDQTMGMPQLFGLPQRVDPDLPEGATLAQAVETGSASSYEGNGSVKRNEKLTLRVAATVVEKLPNGVLRIEGQQEVRVNFEMRELIVTGYVRPTDISRQNEITYDKIAGARISYGGRGQITDVQQPRYGDQILDQILPF